MDCWCIRWFPLDKWIVHPPLPGALYVTWSRRSYRVRLSATALRATTEKRLYCHRILPDNFVFSKFFEKSSFLNAQVWSPSLAPWNSGPNIKPGALLGGGVFEKNLNLVDLIFLSTMAPSGFCSVETPEQSFSIEGKRNNYSKKTCILFFYRIHFWAARICFCVLFMGAKGCMVCPMGLAERRLQGPPHRLPHRSKITVG